MPLASLLPHSSRCLLTSATSPRAAARMRAVSPSEEGLFTAGSALTSTSLRPAGPSNNIFCLIVINPQSRIVPMIHTPAYSSQAACALCHLCFRK
ncbi:Chromosome segregation ATPase [Giardia duodenalis assemblage B]|uniref:Chromosome segregation ATPase n=1 Tax=Giardia duodenalis assemblage B TaxID=1394984 RepID=A0A132NNH3_GIAIN|nr:Chromosome segregation ATPase [Giardia intestinalis assemblage B]